MEVQASWTGKWPNYWVGKWTLICDGIDYSELIPFRDSCANTEGGFTERSLSGEKYYYDGLDKYGWIEENKTWLNKISTNPKDHVLIFEAFQDNDWRPGCCGGCI